MPPAAWDVRFFRRHRDDDPAESVPGVEFLDNCPIKVAATFQAIVSAVAEAPPPRFAGGGQWEVMHGQMKGFYEARTRGADGRLYRLFCILEREVPGHDTSAVVIVTGKSKPRGTGFSPGEYQQVVRLGTEYRSRDPRSITEG